MADDEKTVIPDDLILEMLQADLEKLNPPVSTLTYLKALISTAKAEIKREGITLDIDDSADQQTVEMYAAYLYRKRALSDNGMPRMLRYRLNNRLLSEKMKTSEEVN